MLTDTHCHLNLAQFDSDRDAVLERARAAGLVRLLIPAIDFETSRSAVRLSSMHAEIYAAVGLHPNNLGDWGAGSLERIRNLAGGEKVVALGEIGLDYFWDTHPRERQEAAFLAQLDLAAELELPVVIHNREATADVLAVLEEWSAGLRSNGSPLAGRPGVLHSFSGDWQAAERAMAAGFMIGITGPVTFKNAPEVQSLAAALPLDRLLIETDSPYLTPHPQRGKRNEPACVLLVAEKIAQLRETPLEELLRATYENSIRLFAW